MPFSYLFMFSQTSKMQGAHKCHSQKKNNKKNNNKINNNKKSSQVTFIYIALFTIQIVSKQLHSEQSQYTKNTSLASGLILQSQYSVDTAFTTTSLYPPDHFIL